MTSIDLFIVAQIGRFYFFISSILTIIPRKLVAPFARVTSFRLGYH